MAVRVKVSGSSQETGALLTEMLQARRLYDPLAKATVCYGYSTEAQPNLNQECGTDKIERLERLRTYGVQTIPWSTTGEGLRFPMLARVSMGYGGTDIVPVFQEEELEWRRQSGFDWFSEYVPLITEFRVWVFRGKHLGTYEKDMVRSHEYKYIGRNFRNGFDFHPIVELPLATKLAHAGCDAVGLDFAAVDMLLGKDGKLYILELNTAPGVIRSGAQASLERLVDCIEEWDGAGYPERVPIGEEVGAT